MRLSMKFYPEAALGEAMKVQQVILRVLAETITLGHALPGDAARAREFGRAWFPRAGRPGSAYRPPLTESSCHLSTSK